MRSRKWQKLTKWLDYSEWNSCPCSIEKGSIFFFQQNSSKKCKSSCFSPHLFYFIEFRSLALFPLTLSSHSLAIYHVFIFINCFLVLASVWHLPFTQYCTLYQVRVKWILLCWFYFLINCNFIVSIAKWAGFFFL